MKNPAKTKVFILAVAALASLAFTSCSGMGKSRVNSLTNQALSLKGSEAMRDNERIAAQAKTFVESMAEEKLFSGTILIAKDGEILYCGSAGMADVAREVPNDKDTRFILASLSKQFTAAAILLLEEQGKLKVGDKISMYLKDVPVSWKEITIYQLLTHTSGITYIPSSFIETHYQNTVNPDETIEAAQSVSLRFAPGKDFYYSDSGYIALGRIVELVSGQSFDEFLRKNIFTKIGMKNTGYSSKPETFENLALGYTEDGYKVGPSATSLLFSAGGMYGSAEDLFRFDQALYGSSVLSKKSVGEMFEKKVKVVDDLSYGYGYHISELDGHPFAFQSGSMPGYTCFNARFLDDEAQIIILSNQHDLEYMGNIWIGMARILFNWK